MREGREARAGPEHQVDEIRGAHLQMQLRVDKHSHRRVFEEEEGQDLRDPRQPPVRHVAGARGSAHPHRLPAGQKVLARPRKCSFAQKPGLLKFISKFAAREMGAETLTRACRRIFLCLAPTARDLKNQNHYLLGKFMLKKMISKIGKHRFRYSRERTFQSFGLPTLPLTAHPHG